LYVSELDVSPSLFYSFPLQVQLEEVEVTSGEEEEAILYEQRSKLFIHGETLLDKGSGQKSWRERGIGDVKILQHKELKKVRVLMRQEKTMKVILNFVLDSRLVLTPNAGNDRSWVWSAMDFSSGEELEETVFAIRFGDSDIANAFKKAFEDGQAIMVALDSAEEGEAAEATAEDDAAADEAAEQLSELKTSD
jgi:Ran-binding protein 1